MIKAKELSIYYGKMQVVKILVSKSKMANSSFVRSKWGGKDTNLKESTVVILLMPSMVAGWPTIVGG